MRAQTRSITLGGSTNLAVLAPVKEGLAEGFEPISYRNRLGQLLNALHASRQNVRESEMRSPAFADTIGRFGLINNFRYALVPPERVNSDRWHLSLNITFDGGWEPYMRVIHRDLGPLLDALFCHCDGYPGSLTASYDDYCRWVRSNEIGEGILYTESSVTVGDQRYLSAVERIQREEADPARAAERAARHVEPSEGELFRRGAAAVMADPQNMLALPVRTLRGLYKLVNQYSGNEGETLLRIARLILRDFVKLMGLPGFTQNPAWQPMEALLADELAWLRTALPEPKLGERDDLDLAQLQAAVLRPGVGANHGALVLLEVRDAHKAAAFIKTSLAPRCAQAAAEGTVGVHLALSHSGLQALGIHKTWLDDLAPEFTEGMEARCGILGDVRANHPNRWKRPLRHNGAPGQRVELDGVHVAVMLRVIDPAYAGHALHPRLEALRDELNHSAVSGMSVLAVQPTRSRQNRAGLAEGHFGFADGLSQPVIKPAGPPANGSDEVRPGDLLLGHANGRGDGALPPAWNDLLDNGTYLVVRKLRQRLDHLEEALGHAPGRDATLALMMGRKQDGTALVPTLPGQPNAFDYQGDREGAACPVHSHVRRANPRDGREYTPRLLRRGMSYGPARHEGSLQDERGLLFMAYAASLAEQFEVIQGWLAGGNSSGGLSAQSDPYLGVPKAGEHRVFRCIGADGKAMRVDLGSQPLVELEWGMYFFVPSLKALTTLEDYRMARPDIEPDAPAQLSEQDQWRVRLEERVAAAGTWAQVRAKPRGEMQAPGYGHLVGRADGVMKALKSGLTPAKPLTHSVDGFGERMEQCGLGRNHLGMDPAQGHDRLAKPLNDVIYGVTEQQAFDLAMPVVKAFIQKVRQLPIPEPDGLERVPIDLMRMAEVVIGALSKHWFGLPDGVHMLAAGRLPFEGAPAALPARCPGHIIGPSRAIFTPHPRTAVEAEGVANGPPVLEAARKVAAGGIPGGTLTQALRDALVSAGVSQEALNETMATALAGVLLGFPPTVYGNYLSVMREWIDSGTLWQQQALLARAQGEGYGRVKGELRDALLTAMRGSPVPPMVWRNPVGKDGAVEKAPERQVILGLASAVQDSVGRGKSEVANAFLFGGDYARTFDKTGKSKTTHACPGANMGLGVMLALVAGLFDAGTLRLTGSPVQLILTPRA